MGIFEHFPYTNYHDLNLDKILERTAEAEQAVADSAADAQEAASDAAAAEAKATLALNTAISASSAASNAVNTANTASNNATNAVNTANAASSAAANAVNTANTALAHTAANFTIILLHNGNITYSDITDDELVSLINKNVIILAPLGAYSQSRCFYYCKKTYKEQHLDLLNPDNSYEDFFAYFVGEDLDVATGVNSIEVVVLKFSKGMHAGATYNFISTATATYNFTETLTPVV